MQDYIYGKNTVLSALQDSPKRVNKVYIHKKNHSDNRINKIKELAGQNGVAFQFVDTEVFSAKLEAGVAHQGVMASVSPTEFVELEDFLAKDGTEYRKIVILDGVSDPHNMGAIIRTCAAAGYDAVLVGSHRACPVNATVEKISSGAINNIDIIKVNSLSAAVDTLKNNDWWIIATEMNAKNNYFEIDYTGMNFALILGAEGTGVTKTLINKADFIVKIPCSFESLNVSTSCAVIVYESVRQTLQKEFQKNKK